EGGQLFLPADCRTDALVLIGCDSHTVGAAAYQDAPIKFAIFYGCSHRMREIRVIHGLGGMGAEIVDCVACAFQEVHQLGLIGKTSMVSADGDGVWYAHG